MGRYCPIWCLFIQWKWYTMVLRKINQKDLIIICSQSNNRWHLFNGQWNPKLIEDSNVTEWCAYNSSLWSSSGSCNNFIFIKCNYFSPVIINCIMRPVLYLNCLRLNKKYTFIIYVTYNKLKKIFKMIFIEYTSIKERNSNAILSIITNKTHITYCIHS